MTADKTEKEYLKTGKKRPRKAKDILRFFCHMGTYLFLFVFVVLYAFYAPEGYIQIATNKHLFFQKMATLTAAVMIPLIALYLLTPPIETNLQKIAARISATDIFVLFFLLVNIISFLGTEYTEEALWGTDGWYMGFVMQLFFVGVYFLMSRFYDGRIDLLPVFMAVTFVLFLWGLLNRFSIYPVDMRYDSPQFISSMGNINWFCGFWSVFFVIGVVLYLITDKLWMRLFSGIYSLLALGLGAVEGSDSAYLCIVVVFFFLFLVSFQKTEYMKRWLEECMFYCIACQIMRVIVKISPEHLNVDGFETVMKIMMGNLTLMALVLLGILRFLLGKKDRAFQKERRTADASGAQGAPEGRENPEKGELIRQYRWIKYTAIVLVIAAIVLYLFLLVINTRTPGILGPLSRYHKVFLFNGSWGSARGATWMDGIAIFQTFSWRQRLFGIGQDCFAIYGYSVPELSARLTEEWVGSRLTNAHNECLTYLVNLGIFGMLSFIGIFGSSFKRLLERAKKEPLCYVFAASLLSYFFNNQFSFSQELSTPYMFMMLGLGENLMRRCGRRGKQAGDL